MIAELTVENIAIIDRVALSLGTGLTVLTGETGAGKSLLVDAIELVLGERADSELVRDGATKASVSVVFDLSSRPEVVDTVRNLGIDLEDDNLYIQRDVFAEGRSQCRINGKLTPVGQLRQIGAILVDLHGQHDHQSLLDPLRHADFFDEWIGPAAISLKSQIEDKYSEVLVLRGRLEVLRRNVRDREHRLDLLRFQVNEIEIVQPIVGEFEELEATLSRLKNVERLAESVAASLDNLNRDQGANDLARQATKEIESVSRHDAGLESLLATLSEAQVKLEEASYELSRYADLLEADPSALEECAGRLDDLKKLRRKYGADEQEVLTFLASAQQELAQLEDAEGSEEELQSLLHEQEMKLTGLSAELTKLRSEKAGAFDSVVEAQLSELAMPRARFQVSILPRTISESGGDAVEFLFSANAGESLRPLSKIASGGEISRVMLGIKTAMAGRAGVPTLIFDEVDSGLGGAAAATVGAKLQELAQNYQVLVISHLGAIAARGSTHFRIEKVERGGRMVTQVQRLDEEERVEEIARMLVGDTSSAARASATQLLTSSGF